MKKLRENRGITLIALIITIIVMLILVVVSVTVALNGGLFDTAKRAGSETQLKAEEEMLLSAVVGAIGTDAKVDSQKLKENLPSGFKVSEGTYISPNGNVFAVTETGEITEGWINNGDGTYTKGDTTIVVGKTIYTDAEVKEKLGVTGGTNVGDWVVIGVEGDKIKLRCLGSIGSVILGYNDPRAVKAIPAAGSTPTDQEKQERAIWSYNHAIETLDKATQDATGIPTARCLKVEDIRDVLGKDYIGKENFAKVNGTVFNYYYDEINKKVYSKYVTEVSEDGNAIWSEPKDTGYETQTFIAENGEKVVVDSKGDGFSVRTTYNPYNLTESQKEIVGNLATGIYWLANTRIHAGGNWAAFSIADLVNGSINIYALFYSYNAPIDVVMSVIPVVLI